MNNTGKKFATFYQTIYGYKRLTLKENLRDDNLPLQNPIQFLCDKPSTADQYRDDPTTRKIRKFCLIHGYDSYKIVNVNTPNWKNELDLNIPIVIAVGSKYTSSNVRCEQFETQLKSFLPRHHRLLKLSDPKFTTLFPLPTFCSSRATIVEFSNNIKELETKFKISRVERTERNRRKATGSR